MFFLRTPFFSFRHSEVFLSRSSRKSKSPKRRHSTATYCAEIFFPFGKSNFKGQRSRARRWNLRKRNAGDGGYNRCHYRPMKQCISRTPPRGACILLTRNIDDGWDSMRDSNTRPRKFYLHLCR